MSRAGYSDDLDPLELGRWRGRVASAMRGKRGQEFLRELLANLDALPQKRLVSSSFEEGGEVCALGSVGRSRGIDMSKWYTGDEYDECFEGVGTVFGIANSMAREIMFMNDEGSWHNETPEDRFIRMRNWVVKHLTPNSGATPKC